MRPTLLVLALLASVTTAAAETKPRPFAQDPRIRHYVYDAHEVYRLDTYLRFITAIEFAAGENITSVQVGDSESWQIVRLNRGDVLSIKPLIDGAYTNMTVYTDRRAYTFELRARQGQVGSPNLNYRVSFTYPEEEAARRRKAAERALRPRDYDYHAAGKAASIRPIQVYDDGRQTFFVFPEGARRPAIFAADASGRESVVNVTPRRERERGGRTLRALDAQDRRRGALHRAWARGARRPRRPDRHAAQRGRCVQMSDQTGTGSGHADPVGQRRARLEGRSANPVVRVLTGALLLVAFAAVAVLILAPGEVKRLFTAGASESEDMQEPSTPASDLMFEPTTEPVEVVTTDPTIVLPPAEDDADPDRIAALEREIEALRAANGQSAEELRALLAEQAATLQEQFDRERASLEERHQRELQDALAARPVTAGIGDLGESEAEAEARRRLEEERARRAEIREAQIMSDGIVLDAGGSITGGPQGAGGSGARPPADGQRGVHRLGQHAELRYGAGHRDRRAGPDGRARHRASGNARDCDLDRASRRDPGRRQRRRLVL